IARTGGTNVGREPCNHSWQSWVCSAGCDEDTSIAHVWFIGGAKYANNESDEHDTVCAEKEGGAATGTVSCVGNSHGAYTSDDIDGDGENVGHCRRVAHLLDESWQTHRDGVKRACNANEKHDVRVHFPIEEDGLEDGEFGNSCT